MIKARHTFGGRCLAELFSGYMMERVFPRITFAGSFESTDAPVLLLANHFCWWDGFIQYRLNKKIPGHRLFVMMLGQQLRRNMVLSHCGCFSIDSGSRSVVESLDYCLGLLRRPGNTVLVFPQGAIRSMHSQTVEFRSGLGYILKRLPAGCRILFNVNLADFGSEKRPGLTVYFREFGWQPSDSLDSLSCAYNEYYRECKLNQQSEQ